MSTENQSECEPSTVSLSDALKCTGFQECQWDPDETSCEKCGKRHVQMYFGNPSYWDGREGDYWCADCVIAMHQSNHVAQQAAVDKEKLIALIDDIDRRLPLCTNDAFQMIAYEKPEDLLQPVRDGRLVVISRGMLRRIRKALRQ